MGKTSSTSGVLHLLEQTEKSFEGLSCWTWPELLIALKQCQESPRSANSLIMLKKCMNFLVRKIVLADGASPCPSASSVDSSRFRLSCDSKSTESLKTCITWWFEDILIFSPESIEMFVKSMISHDFDQVLLSKFLIHFQKSKFLTTTMLAEKRKVIESSIDSFYLLDENASSLKALLDILLVSFGLNVNKRSRKKLEAMIGSKLDHATLDNLLVPSPNGVNYLYDVNLVLRLFKVFLSDEINRSSPSRLTKVASLMDSYMTEVAPDPCLKFSKFRALAIAIPDTARMSYDEMYHAMDLYFEMHSGMSEEEKMEICCALNYEKLSYEVCIHFSKNPKFPLPQTPIHPLKSLIQDINYSKSLIHWPCDFTDVINTSKNDGKVSEQIVLYHGKFDSLADDEKFKAQMEGMQWRVLELEKLCRKMQTQMRKILKSQVPRQTRAKSVPKLCS